MLTVRLVVGNADIDVSTNAGRWHLRSPNRIYLRRDKGGGWVIIGIGDHGDVTEAGEGSKAVEAFSSTDFDPDVAIAATRFWYLRAVDEGYGRWSVRPWLTRPSVELAWSSWPRIPADARRSYLDHLVRYLAREVVVNGRPAARWSRIRRLLGLPPVIAEVAIRP